MKPERVLVTGTTSGVGLALLELYSKSGAQVIAVNRRRVPELEAKYPQVRFECVDVRSAEQVVDLVRRLEVSAELPDVFILNAGINRIDNDASFDLASFEAVLATNLYGVLNFVQPITRLSVGGAARHVVAISSMANYVGNPYGLGYHTSKRALTACFAAWSSMYVDTDLVFQRVMLGPVRTEMVTMHAHFPSWMVWVKHVFSASLDGTARAIARFATTRRSRLFYPWQALPLYLGMWIGQSCVPGFFQGQKTLAGTARRRAQDAARNE